MSLGIIHSSRVKRNAGFALESCLPFSNRVGSAELREQALNLVDALGLSTGIEIIEGNSQSGLVLESRFRLKWWASGEEPLRAALHRAKAQAYRQARQSERWEELSEAWRRVEKTVRSANWRQHLLDITREANPTADAYLRLAFRAAQQVWSREARWLSIMPASAPDPFTPLVELLVNNAWPLGCHDGSLHVFLWNESVTRASDFGSAFVDACSADKQSFEPQSHIFLSAQFRDSELIERWKIAFEDQGWDIIHGPVSEDVTPPEVQLGKRIRDARATVGLIDEFDSDYGLPWWMYQELDYAAACKRPVVLISQSDPGAARAPDIAKIQCAMSKDSNPLDQREIWDWLKINATRV